MKIAVIDDRTEEITFLTEYLDQYLGERSTSCLLYTSGCETTKTYTKESISEILKTLESDTSYGTILRAKGMVEGENGEWIYFDMVPEDVYKRQGGGGAASAYGSG